MPKPTKALTRLANPVQRAGLPQLSAGEAIRYLTDDQVNKLTEAFQAWYDSSPNQFVRRTRGRYWLVYLALRFTGARVGEALLLNDQEDIEFRKGEVRLITLKRHSGKRPMRIVPVPMNVTSEVATYLAQHPEARGKVFGVDQGNFRRQFYQRAREAKIPRELAHPHILRHTRAIELLRAGIPVTIVQDLLGHSALTTTAIYLRMSGQEAKSILKDKGFI